MTEELTKKPSSMLKYLAFFLFIVILGVLLWSIVAQDYRDYEKVIKRPQVFEPREKIVIRSAPAVAKLPEPEPVPTPPQLEILSLTERVEKLENQNRSLTFYIAARELKEKIANPAESAAQLEFVSALAANQADIAGRVDLLKQASSNGLPTQNGLINELTKIADRIEQKRDKTFWGSIKNSFNGLVKITKIKGKVDDEDYQTTLKRVELALKNSDYKTAAIEAENLGIDGGELVKKINNIQRVIEITDSLVEFSKASFVSDKEEIDGEVL